MDLPTSETTPPEPPPERPLPTTPREERIQDRLEKLVGTDETIVAWSRGWISREVRLQKLFGARTFDFVVVTERSLLLFSTGFFTRRARRLVYSGRLDRMFVTSDNVSHGRRIRVTARQSNPILVELRESERATRFADELLARAHGEAP